MSYIDDLHADNLTLQFNLSALLENSVFYPASGIDGIDIECLTQSHSYASFIHVDYTTARDTVVAAMTHHFRPVGYELMGGTVIPITQEQLTPDGFTPHFTPPNVHERARLQRDFIRRAFNGQSLRRPFALWAVFELSPLLTAKKGKIKRFSLLHLGGEAVATFDALYLNRAINPSAVVISNPGEGYGDNWTLFTNPSFRLHVMMLDNVSQGATMPRHIFTNMTNGPTAPCFWPGYHFEGTCHAGSHNVIYRYQAE